MFQAPSKFVWMNGEIVPWEKATVHVFTHALHYGTGVFEGIRAYKSGDDLLVFRLSDHIDRMFRSAAIYGFDMPYSKTELCNAVLDLIRENEFHTSLYIRPIAFKGVSGISLDARNSPTSVSVIAFPYERYFDPNKLGLSVCVSTWRRLGDPAVPAMAKACGHYVNSVLARTESAEAGFDEALFLDDQGNVAEGTGENIFVVRDGRISTPVNPTCVLLGITRQTVIDLINDHHWELCERTVARAELYTCDEAFFTGTAAEVAPILSVDRKTIGNGKPGPITLQLQKDYENLVTGANPKYSDHVTSVYGKKSLAIKSSIARSTSR